MNRFFSIFVFSLLFSFTALGQYEIPDYTSDHKPGSYEMSNVSILDYLDAGQWCPSGTFPDLPAATYFQAAAWLGDTLYVQTPTTAGAAATTIIKYTMNGSWTTGVPLPAARVGGTLTACNGKLYYFGGGNSGVSTNPQNTLYEYNPATGEWLTKAPGPLALAAHRAVNWGDSVLIVLGGPYTGSATNLNVYYYRPAADAWGTITNSLPTGQGRRTFACGLTNNKIIMAGGYNTAFLKSVYIGVLGASAADITWHQGPVIPTVWTGLSRPGGEALGDYFYIICGERGGPGGYYDTTHIMNVNTETWFDVVNNKPFKMSNISSGVAIKSFLDSIKVFVPGGYGSVSGATPGAASSVFDVIGCGNLLLIPVELKSFSYNIKENNITVQWSTATEKNNSGFELQRSYNNGVFQTVTFVSGNGTTTQQHDYSYIDKNLENGSYQYRLVQIDLDGTRSYSQVIEAVMDYKPENYALMQNYPNPFNPVTTISYQLAENNHVSLTVYNVLGDEVALLVNEPQVQGKYNVQFNAGNLASGVYYYKLTAGKFSETKKFILMK